MGTVLHRITLERIDSAHTPDYNPGLYLINPDLSTVTGFPTKYWKVIGSTVILKNSAEQAVADAEELSETKGSLLKSVDVRSESQISNSAGLEYPAGSGKFLSTSTESQLKWTSWNSIADNWVLLGLTFPFRVRTINGDDYIEVQNAAEIKTIFNKITQRVVSVLADTEVIKAAIVSATSVLTAQSAATAYLQTVQHNLILADEVATTDAVTIVLEVLQDTVEITDTVTRLLV